MGIIVPGQEKVLGKIKRTALIFIGIELVAFGLSVLLGGLLISNLVVLPVFYGYGLLRYAIRH